VPPVFQLPKLRLQAACLSVLAIPVLPEYGCEGERIPVGLLDPQENLRIAALAVVGWYLNASAPIEPIQTHGVARYAGREAVRGGPGSTAASGGCAAAFSINSSPSRYCVRLQTQLRTRDSAIMPSPGARKIRHDEMSIGCGEATPTPVGEVSTVLPHSKRR